MEDDGTDRTLEEGGPGGEEGTAAPGPQGAPAPEAGGSEGPAPSGARASVARARAWLGACLRGPFLGPASVRIGLVASAALALSIAIFSPLTGVPGPESALVLGVGLAPLAAGIGARLALGARGAGASGARLAWGALRMALALVAVSTAVLALDGLRVRWCEPWTGLAFVALGPGVGVPLAALAGTATGCLVSRPRVATALAVTIPLLATLGTATHLYTTPAIDAYGHFFGWFPGTLYDPDIQIEAPYLSFRALGLLQAAGFAALLVGAVDPDTARFSVRRARSRPGPLALGALAFTLALAGEAHGIELGHRSTALSITRALGTTLHGQRCDVVVPRELPRERAERLRDDCDFRVVQAARALGVEQRRRITAFFFRSAAEKRELMGASGTYIAKPWRDEVYLQLGSWPHPVLAHEIVHVVAGNLGRGPFRIAGRAGGWLPSPGIIEGLAVAVAWQESDGLTPHEWARAMIELDLAPSIAETEGLGFLLQPASRAYTLSGSFVRWILDTRGPEAIATLYRTGDYRAALGRSVAEAEADWRRWLVQEVPLPPEALALAEARFERAGIFSLVCPHAVAALMGAIGDELGAGDDTGAARDCRAVLAIDPRDSRARAWLAVALARRGDRAQAEEQIAALVGPPRAARPILRSAREGVADALWARGDSARAAALYRTILEEPLAEDDARQLEVRLLAIESGLPGGAELREIFAPPGARSHDAVTAMAAMGRLRALRADGLGAYLEARQMWQRERFDLARPAMDEALARGLPTARLDREARRMDASIASGAGDRARAGRVWQQIAADPSLSESARVEARDWLERLAWEEGRGER